MLKDLIRKGESETLEFKKSLGEWKEIIQVISAFANTKGGTIILGINEERKVFGVQIGKRTTEDLTNKIRRNTDPKISPRILVNNLDGEDIITIKVEESKSKPVFAFDRTYKRVGKSTVRATSEEIRKMALEGKKIYWDEQICEEASLKHVDEEKVRWFLREARTERGLPIDENTPIKQMLTQLKLKRDHKPTNAAIILFGIQPKRFFLQSAVKCVHFHGTDVEKPFESFQVYNGNLFRQVDNSLNFVLERIRRSLIPEYGKPTSKRPYEIPEFVIREAIVNAVAHRDYFSTASVQVMVFTDRIEVWNPGELPSQLTLEALRKVHPSIPRNPLIAELFYLAKYIEKVGSGTNEMIKQCKKEGLPEPEFQQKMGSFVAIVWRNIYTDEYLDMLDLNDRQKRVVKYVKEQGSISNSEYCGLFSVSRKTATNDLVDLVNKNIFDIVGTGKRDLRYVLKLRKNYAKTTQNKNNPWR